MSDFGPAISVLESHDTIYVGGTNDVGYLLPGEDGLLFYQSLKTYLMDTVNFSEVWQIVSYHSNIYFESYEMILRWDGKLLRQIPVKDAFIFNIEDRLVVSIYNKGTGVIENDSLVQFQSYPLENDAIFKILPDNQGKLIAFTSESGLYRFDAQTLVMKKWNVQASAFFKRYQFYDAITWQDSLFIATSWKNGAIIIDQHGSIIDTLNTRDGLPNFDLKELFVDSSSDIWITAESGVYELKWPGLSLNGSNFKTIIRFVDLDNKHLTTVQTNDYLPGSVKYASFHFTTPGMDKEDLEYSTFLEGFDKDWSGWNKIARKEYTNLSGGNYIFHVKAKLPNGQQSTEATFKLDIPTPFYLNPLLYTALIFIIIVSIVLINRIRLVQLKKRTKNLEEMIYSRISELIKQREQLKQANTELITSNEELDNFVYRSSHDLIAPLKSIRGLVQIMSLESNKDKESIDKYLGMMTESIMKLERFINSIMEYTINSKQDNQYNEVDLESLIDEIIEGITHIENANLVHIQKKLAVKHIMTDKNRLSIVLSNLLTNGIKYQDLSRNKPTLTISSASTNGLVEIILEDNGHGIQEKHLPHIFDMFYRASEIAGGSGLGLYIVKDAITKMGGSIEVDSLSGQGSTFTITLPDSSINSISSVSDENKIVTY